MKGQQPDYKYTNALIHETSPYLLQHAHNPVNWQPWSQEALAIAKKENKLVLVSIGYSSCHWCHVMEEETFEDEATAKMMNENFINIKVDREERPDVDQVYMTAVQLINGNGGWPLNVILLPNGKPIYGGTYHTKSQWNEVLTKISNLYHKEPQKANEYADRVAEGIRQTNIIQPSTNLNGLTKDALKSSVDHWSTFWDRKWGGDQGRQKFMLPGNLGFLMDFAQLSGEEAVWDHVKTTLDRMAMGGVYDQIGGGFFRYSTDSHWKVPHFEKMLYDNAQLIGLYSRAYKIFKNPVYKEIVINTVEFLEREMKDPEGGYYAALDADSEGEEGKFYVWTMPELKEIIHEDYSIFSAYFNISPKNAWEKDQYVLYKSMPDKEFEQKHGLSEKRLKDLKKEWKEKLMSARTIRVRPRTDDKIITSWNALLINGFVEAYQAFGDKKYLERAESTFALLQRKAYQESGLVHSFKKGSKRTDGFLEDYAFLENAALKLYSASMDVQYLTFAQEINNEVVSGFTDPVSGMFRYVKDGDLISNIIKTNDGVIPSPNGTMAQNLFILGHINYDLESMKKAKTMLAAMMPSIQEHADSYSSWNSLLLNTVYPYYEVAVVGTNAPSLLASMNEKFLPNTLIVGTTKKSDLPLFEMRFRDKETFIYVCQNTTCKLPSVSVEEALDQLKNF
ncbi:thioredoxin domain-containing protein [Flavobacteriaceae bacterium F89]|uniref:Thioredoxin domain-containing protein n=1 Tax=Cerina litoralis TaxID=2874477 RepID=A0AAE3EUJ2_9FLAO|nr:thioredoxin domain-containing protein [Cerina litoralis]MCG2460720.1 thioredoxin domain-containing protein [Cerina litoralis]